MAWFSKLVAGIVALLGTFFGPMSTPVIPAPVPIQNQQATTTVTQSQAVNPTNSSETSTSSAQTATTTISFQGQPSIFSKNSTSVYQDDGVDTAGQIPNADSATFVVVADWSYQDGGLSGDADNYSEWIAKDKNNVYFAGVLSNGLLTLSGADPATFTPIDNQCSKDKNHVYNYAGKIFAADPATFVSLGDGYYKDKNGFFYNSTPIKIQDPATFTVLSNGYAKDADSVYDDGVVTQFDPSTFVVLDDVYAKDSTKVYLQEGYGGLGETGFITGADAPTFKVLSLNTSTFDNPHEYAEDANHVYFGLDVVAGADPATFTLCNSKTQSCQNYDASDKNHQYDSGEVVQ